MRFRGVIVMDVNPNLTNLSIILLIVSANNNC